MRKRLFPVALALLLVPHLCGQSPIPEGQLDPTRNPPVPPQTHTPLPEQYIWTANDITVLRPDRSKYSWARQDLRIEPHFFRASFNVANPPKDATVYLAGPRSARVWINGQLARAFNSDVDAPIGFHVFACDIARFLHRGVNTVAIEAVRGRGIVAGAGPISTQQITYGEVLAAKIVPAPPGVEAPALVLSSPAWKSASTLAQGWEQPGFNDSAWPAAASLGPVESDPDLMQWSADSGMYEWPGYLGMSSNLRTLALLPQAVSHLYEGQAHFSDPKALATGQPFTVTGLASGTDLESPALLLDFGREIAGRLLIRSAASCEATLSVAYGESDLEALATGLTPGQRGGNYLGTNLLHVPSGGTVRGPKSAFRFARIRFLRGCPTLTFASIGAEAIYYPVTYAGSFQSSDPLLNRIWESGAYTAHLCMQDGIWDAPKRDRGRWVGDLDIEGRVISTAFGDTAMIEDTLNRLAAATSPNQHVNGIASYSALWLTSLDSLFQHSADRAFLTTQRGHILQILARLDQDIDTTNLLAPSSKGWGFVDWAPGFYGQTAETRIGTNLQYLRGFAAGARLLDALADPALAKYAARAATLREAARAAYLDPATQTIGRTWQLNALAILDFPSAAGAIAENALSTIKQDAPSDPVISPYFNAYLIDALAVAGHQQQALDWIRAYWGGMLAEGATSLWESYDLRWPKSNPHLSLQADGTSGYFVSMAHGWSAGPTAWLSENVLGITPAAPGYASVSIAPHLLNLEWARGVVPTPHGPVGVAIDKASGLTVDLPPGVTASVVWGGKTQRIDRPGRTTIP